MTDALWQLGGWTMLHFLWAGTGVALVGGALRFACRRAAPGVRYAASLGTLAMLALMPVGIAGWLYSPAILAGRGDVALPNQELNVRATSQDDSAIYTEAPRAVDLAFDDPAATGAAPMLSVVDPTAALPLFATVVATLPWVWLVGAPLTFALLAAGLVGSERLRRTGTVFVEGPVAAACERLRQAMRITRRVSVAVCDGVAQPVLVGIVRPLILLPAAALSGWTPEELEMVLMHELAHVRRWDNLVNLVQRIVESALFFHPAVWLVSRQVRRDREECCDAIVVARTERPEAYASLLVSIAATLRRGQAPSLAAASAMADHPLAGRVRRILKLEDEPMWISRRTLGATAAAMLGILLAGAVVYGAAAAAEERRAETVTEERRDTALEERATAEKESEATEERRAEAEEERNAAEEASAAATENESSEAIVASNLKKKIGEWQLKRKAAESELNDLEAVSQASQARLKMQMDRLKEKMSAKDRLDPEVEIPRVRADIARLEGLIAKETQNLANVEIFKQLALQNARSPAAIEQAVSAELANDKMIANYEEKLHLINDAIQQRQASSRNPNDPQLTKLVKQLQQTQQMMAQHRAQLEKSAREQIAKMPNEAFRAAIVEYKIRLEAAKANLAKHEAELEAAKERLAEFLKEARAKTGDAGVKAIEYLEKNKVTPPGIDPETGQPMLAPGRFVRVQVLGAFPDHPIDKVLVVEPQGTLALGEAYGRVEVGGKTIEEAEKAVDAHLRKVLTDPTVQIQWEPQRADADELSVPNTQSPAASSDANPWYVIPGPSTTQGLPDQPHETRVAPPPWPPRAGSRESYFYFDAKPGSRETTYLYDGKTFEDWRSLWKNELKTERRIEAIEALAAFGRAGQGKEAAEAIFEVTDQYDPTAGLGPGESKLIEAVVNVVSLMPSGDWMPLVLERLANDDSAKKQRWRAYAAAFLNGARPRPEDRELAMKFAEHADGELTVSLASYALRGDRELADPGTVELVRKGLRNEPTNLNLLYGLNFDHVDKAPEQIALLVHSEAGERARDFIRSSAQDRPGLAAVLTDPLLAILDDPERRGEHAAALRALRALSPALRHRDMQEHAARVVERLGRLLQEGGDETAIPAYVALYHVKKGTAMETLADILHKEGVLTADRAEKLKAIDPQAFIDESNEQ